MSGRQHRVAAEPARAHRPNALGGGLVLAGGYLVYASANAVVPLAAELRAQLGLDGAGAAVFLVPFAVGFAAGVPLWALVAGRWPAARTMVVALLAASVGGLLVAVTAQPEVAVAARVLLGLAAAGYAPAAQAFVADAVAPARRGRALAGFVAAVVAGSFAGQATAGVLGDALGARAALLGLTALLPALVAVALAVVLRATTVLQPAQARPRIVAVGAATAPVLAVAALTFGGYWLLLSALPSVLRSSPFELSAAEAGLVPLLGSFGIAGALVSGRLVDRHGQRLPMCVVLAVGVASLGLAGVSGENLMLFAIGFGLFASAYWSYLPPAAAEIAARTAPGSDRQAGLRLLYAAMWLGAALSPLLLWVTSAWAALAALALIAWAAALLIALLTFTPRAAG
jgi:MFS family permease